MSFLRWLMQRVTALVLVICLAVHTIVIHFSGKSPVADFGAVAERLHNPLWFAFYVIFLGSTLFHALNGTYEIIDDYKPAPILQLAIGVCFTGAGIVALVWGMYVLVNYNIIKV